MKLDRTYLAVQRQLDAMGVESFEVGIRDMSGRMLIRTWTKAETLKSMPWLKRENAKGSNVYVRPSGDKNQGLILVDDLSIGKIEQMKKDGFEPAAVVETSPLNYQAWVRISESPLLPEVATIASKNVSKLYESDPNSADWRHFGRLAGFTNRKPEHTTEDGRNPWVLCHDASGMTARNGPELARKAQDRVFERMARIDSQRRFEEARNASNRDSAWYGPVQDYQRRLGQLEKRYGQEIDLSRADFMIGKEMAKNGLSAERIATVIEEASPELPIRKAGHENDYVERTVKAIFNDPEVVELEAKKEKIREIQRQKEGSRELEEDRGWSY